MCEKHFMDEDIIRTSSVFDHKTGRKIEAPIYKPALEKNAIPRIFKNYPSYFAKNEQRRMSPDAKRRKREETLLCDALLQSANSYAELQNSKRLHSLGCIKKNINQINKNFWNYVSYKSDSIIVCHLSQTLPPKVIETVCINADLSICVYIENFIVTNLSKYEIADSVSNIDEFLDIFCKLEHFHKDKLKTQTMIELVMSFIESTNEYGNSENLKFICEQLNLHLKAMPKYSPELLIFASLFYNSSPSTYNFVRNYGYIKLPSHTTIKRLNSSLGAGCSSEGTHSFLAYIKTKVSSLHSDDKIVNLMMDEIHIKPFFDYKAGTIAGKSFNNLEPATSAHVFMIRSIKTSFKDVIHILPVKRIKAELLTKLLIDIIKELHAVGIVTVSVISDNNAINRKAVSLLSNPPKLSIVYKNPADFTKPLFFLFDSVHLLKCIRNNWLNQKSSAKEMFYPEFRKEICFNETHVASFEALRKLHAIEEHSLLQYCKSVSLKALYPSNIERQNVKLALQIFNEHVVAALRTFGIKNEVNESLGTAMYIEIILKWWTVCNVQTSFKGVRLNNELGKPLSIGDSRIEFLYDFLDWLDKWNELPNNYGKLTKETFNALHHTTYALIEITRYCMEEFSMTSILTARFQTDALESRFGLYRRLSGTVYNISARQLFECENKLRMKSLLKLQLPLSNSIVDLNKMTDYDQDFPTENDQLLETESVVNVDKGDIEAANDYLPVVAYIAGYCCYSILKKTKCESCKLMLTKPETDDLPDVSNFSFINGINRGRLLYPSDISVTIALYSYILVGKLTKQESFLSSQCHRQVACQIIRENLLANDISFPEEFCFNGHNFNKCTQLFIWKACNILLNNFCKQVNSKIQSRISRKITTFA